MHYLGILCPKCACNYMLHKYCGYCTLAHTGYLDFHPKFHMCQIHKYCLTVRMCIDGNPSTYVIWCQVPQFTEIVHQICVTSIPFLVQCIWNWCVPVLIRQCVAPVSRAPGTSECSPTELPNDALAKIPSFNCHHNKAMPGCGIGKYYWR